MSVFARVLPSVAAAERARIQHLAPAFACVAAAAVIARTSGTTLLLQAFDARIMPWMYVATALVVIAGAFGLTSLMARLRPDRVILAVSGLIIVGCVIVRMGIGHGSSFAVAAYLLADVLSRILIGLYWGLAALLLNPREGRRLLGIVGAAGTVACMLAGAAVPVLTARFGARGLLVVAAVLVAGFALAIATLIRREPGAAARLNPPPSTTRVLAPTGANASLLREPLVGSLGILVIASTLALFVSDFVFISAARQLHAGDELAAFLGRFYALGSLLALLVQLLILPWLLRVGGVLAGLVILPATLLVTALGVAATGAFPWIFAAKLAEPVLLFTVDSASMQLLYQGVKRSSRFRARTLIDGIARPLAIAATALALLAGASAANPRVLALVIVVACSAWLLMAYRSAARYVSGLIDLLGTRGLDLSGPSLTDSNPAFASRLRAKLSSAPDGDVPYLLELVDDSTADWSTELEALLSRDNPSLRVQVLELLARRGGSGDTSAIARCLGDASPSVRAAAVRATLSFGADDVVAHLEPLLADDDAEVRALAAARVLGTGDLDALNPGAGILRAMLGSKDPAQRAAAIRALQQVQRPGLARVLAPLLDDPAPAVKAAALELLRDRPAPELVPAMLHLLADADSGGAASDALVACGAAGLTALEAAARSSETPAAICLRLPTVLGRLGLAALPALEALMARGDADVARAALRALCRVVATHGAPPAARARCEQLARIEADQALAAQRAGIRVRLLPGTEFLAHVLDEERREHLDDCLLLLSSSHPSLDGPRLARSIHGGAPDERAAAVEVIHEVLGPELRGVLLPLLEPASMKDQRAAHSDLHDLARAATSEWVAAAALHACGAAEQPSCAPNLATFLHDTRPRVRETALGAVARLVEPATAARHASALTEDPDAAVRAVARHITSLSLAR